MFLNKENSIEVDLGGHIVTVPQGGLYDRYRMDANLDEISQDPRVSDVEFFRQLRKTKIESPIGPTYTPNFYYRVSTARLTMLTRTSSIHKHLPKELAPLEIMPGMGLIFVMFFRYDVCDIDFYTEAAVGIVVRPARHNKFGVIDLIAELAEDHLHAYVLSLPVNTDIAQVRGHDGYGFPKWRTDIDVDIDSNQTSAQVYNEAGGLDLRLVAPTPVQTKYSSGKHVSTLSSYTSIEGKWHSTLTQTHTLSAGNKIFPRGISLERGIGRLTNDLHSLKPIKPVHFAVATESQIALHMPVPTSVPKYNFHSESQV